MYSPLNPLLYTLEFRRSMEESKRLSKQNLCLLRSGGLTPASKELFEFHASMIRWDINRSCIESVLSSSQIKFEITRDAICPILLAWHEIEPYVSFIEEAEQMEQLGSMLKESIS